MSTVTPTQSQVYAALGAFIQNITGLPAGQIIQGLGNRVAMPAPGFIAMTAISQARLRTNIELWDEVDPNPSTFTAEQGTQIDVQLDFYGPLAGDWAVMVSTAFRSSYGFEALAPNCAPLYIDVVPMAPLIDAEAQWEQRWVATAVLQYNPVTTLPLQFANELVINLIDVDEVYPA
jgi:hypothetical protein